MRQAAGHPRALPLPAPGVKGTPMIVSLLTVAGLVLAGGGSAALYLLPVLIGAARRVPDLGATAVINVLPGWTLAGWAVSLAMALRSARPGPPAVQIVQNLSPAPARPAAPCGMARRTGTAAGHARRPAAAEPAPAPGQHGPGPGGAAVTTPASRAVLAGVPTVALAAAAALILATALPHPPARPATAPAAVTTPVLLAARTSPSPATGGSSSCGFLDVSCQIGNAITSWFAALARDALKPLLTVAGQTLLSSPQPGAIPAVHSMWATSLAIADSAYVLLAVIGGVIVMGHETLQTSYSAKEIAPRLVTGFLAANLSLVLISRATTIANALSAALAGDGVTPATAASALLGTLTAPLPGGGILLVLLALAGAVLALVLAVVYVLRLMALVLLTAAAPLALACYALPQTAWAARWWWRALTVCLAIQVAQALALTAAVRVFSSAGWIPLHGTRGGSVLPVLTAICLLYIMMRIPWWISRPVLGAFGPSPIRRTAKFAFYAAVLSRVSPLLRGTAGPRRPPSAAGGRGRGPTGPRGGGTRGPAAPPGVRPGPGPGPGTGPGRSQRGNHNTAAPEDHANVISPGRVEVDPAAVHARQTHREDLSLAVSAMPPSDTDPFAQIEYAPTFDGEFTATERHRTASSGWPAP